MSDFGKAFRAARNAGDKTFTWNGKTYTTQLKDESVTPSSKATNPQTASAMLANMPTGTSAAAAQALGALAAKEQANQAKSSAANAAGDTEDDGFATSTRNMGATPPSKDDGFLGKNMRSALGSQFKKGGVTKKYAKGGHVKSSASSRADGIAMRGHTKGRMR
jgi:hypothetical protein